MFLYAFFMLFHPGISATLIIYTHFKLDDARSELKRLTAVQEEQEMAKLKAANPYLEKSESMYA